jgi:hypothetical protein
MNAEFDIDFPQADVDRLFAAMRRAEVELGKSAANTLSWAMALACNSLKASTRVSAKRRRVLKMQAKHLGISGRLTKAQRAVVNAAKAETPYGVMVWIGGKETFVPIGAKHTKTVDITRKINNQALVKNLASGQIVPASQRQQFSHLERSGASQSTLIQIKRSGLAKQSWGWANQALKRKNAALLKVMDVPGAVSITRGDAGLYIRVENRLKYIRAATKADVGTVIERAAASMENRIADALEKQIKKAAA